MIRNVSTMIRGIVLVVAVTIGSNGAEAAEIGVITFVQGQVTVAHLQSPPIPAKFRDDIRFQDVIETRQASRTKALFQDDSVLTVGESSRVEITEYIFNPHEDRRSVLINLVSGKVRALVGKVFAKPGSRFEVHTPTAVAAARGTYFVVWLNGRGRTGVANIGDHGQVDFTSKGRTIPILPGEFSEETDEGPTTPTVFSLDDISPAAQGDPDANGLPMLSQTVTATDVRETIRVPAPIDSITIVGSIDGITGDLLTAPAAFTGAMPITPPAVISGAAGQGLGTAGAQAGTNAIVNPPVPVVNPPAGPPIVTGPITLPSPGSGGGSGARTP